MPEQHLAEVHEVEECTNPDGVERIFSRCRNPLGVEILLREVTGETFDYRRHKRDDTGYPGEGPPPTPCGHPEFAPQVNDYEGHEQLDAPQMHAVEKMPDRI